MKRIVSLVLTFVLSIASAFGMSGCGYEYQYPEVIGNYTDHNLAGTTLNVYNWGEYISDGSEGSLDVNKAFENATGIKVNYSNYDSNESMYAKMKSEAVSYDIVIPSDYMIERLKNENIEFDVMRQLLDMFKNGIDEMSVQQKRAAIRTLVRKVVWDGKKAHIVLFGVQDGDIEYPDISTIEDGSDNEDSDDELLCGDDMEYDEESCENPSDLSINADYSALKVLLGEGSK